MQLTPFLTTTFALGALAAPSAEPKTSTNNVLARGDYGYNNCGDYGYYFNKQCYCHERNYGYCDDNGGWECQYKCVQDAYWDYNDECCYCYNNYDYSDSNGCGKLY
jgi:hypothetical protein